ncbi:DUF1150 family protein [Pontibaca methylaminivorans]|uniref:DUF1150 family protein n=1 Tax=Pontibaca methylaminivorans TaxID=515897 RepID=A0A1R3WUS9_9RHOB|nr:DUF1150 family protein [Pontibaca methylaminivorans]SIT81736.1 hypothetical protein SAMN05421849_1535 [Pontibaca methylaminivorans]
MNTPQKFENDENRIVYVKTVNVADLPQEVQAEAGDLNRLYALHDAQGQQLALVADRRLAFVLARQHDMSPVAVH